jgi:hypothetical protein
MTEPILTGKTVCDVVAPLVKQCLDEAAKKERALSERSVGYLRAAQMVVNGLHTEFEAIVAQADLCDLGNGEKVEALKIRLHSYLHTNTLRPELWTALEGMHECRSVLQARVDSILNLPWTLNEKKGVLTEFVQMTEQLETYVASLGYEYPSGIGLDMLNELYVKVCEAGNRIETDSTNSRKDQIGLKRITGDPRLTGPLNERRELTARIERTINRLLASF